MELLLARSSKEAHLHMDLHPCRCGDRTRPADSAVLDLDGALASRYSGTCPSCGTQREFLFRLPDELPAPRPGTVVFGAGGPSGAAGPGRVAVGRGPVRRGRAGRRHPPRPGRGREARRAVAYAEAAMGEVLAFVPAGADAVPPEAFRSDRGRTVYGAEPGRFSRARLEVVRQTYREILVEIDALVP